MGEQNIRNANNNNNTTKYSIIPEQTPQFNFGNKSIPLLVSALICEILHAPLALDWKKKPQVQNKCSTLAENMTKIETVHFMLGEL